PSFHSADKIIHTLVFADPLAESILDDAAYPVDTMFADATFKVACTPFSQLLNVKFVYRGHIFAIYHVLMEKKMKALYRNVFKHISDRHPTLELKETMTDFEAGLVWGIAQAFPNATQRGCHFHYQNAIIQKIKSKQCYIVTMLPMAM
ncbi:MAG: hypothetical protein Q8O19_04610, partial [Rectinemataceae bacterium]|nr:hypothetical protein [Rectinemataceae bacterium]